MRSAYLNTGNTGHTIDNLGTESVLAKIRPQYSSPNYLSAEYYDYVSRYSRIRRIQDGSDIFHETFNKYVIPESSSDKYITVNNAVENRLDILACRYYKSAIMWWVIALANNIIDPFTELPMGTVLRIPQLTSVYDSGII